MKTKTLIVLVSLATLLSSCAPAAAPAPVVAPVATDRYLIDPRMGFTEPAATVTDRKFDAAWRAFLAGNDQEAQQKLDDITGKTMGYFPAVLAEAAIDIRAGRLEEARTTVERVRSLAGGTYTAAAVYEAEIAFRMKQNRRALTLYREVARGENAPAFTAERITELETAVFNELFAAAQSAPEGESARLLREALAINAGARGARMLLVQKLVAARQFDEARREIEPLLTSDAASDDVQEALAEIDLGRGRVEDAIKRYERLSRKSGLPRHTTRLDEIKQEWSAANMPAQYRYALENESLTRADFAVLLYWTVPSVRFAQNLPAPPIATDIADVSGRDEIVRAIALGLYEVDAVTRRVSPGRAINAARLSQLSARVLQLRGATCARQVPSERDELGRTQKILASCGIPDPSAGIAGDTPATGKMAQRTLERVAKVLGQ